MYADLLEEVVWSAVADALSRPELLVEEYQRRLKDSSSPGSVEQQGRQVSLALKRVKVQEDRVTDAYINEAMELDRYRVEMEKLRASRKELQRPASEIEQRERQEAESRGALQYLDQFCRRISQGLEALNFEERQELLRLLVEGVTVDDGLVRVETVIPNGSHDD